MADDSKEDPLHRLSRTPTKASRQQQWDVWKQAERERVQPIKEWGKSPTRIHHTRTTTSKSVPSSPNKTSTPIAFSTPPRTTTTSTGATRTKGESPMPDKKKAGKPSSKVEVAESKQTLPGAKMTKKHDVTKKKQSIESNVSTSKTASVLATSTTPSSDKNVVSEVKAESPPKESGMKTQQSTPLPPPHSSSMPDAVQQISIPDKAVAMKLFDQLDENASGKLSLAELDKGIVTLFPDWNNKPAIMAAYKAADCSHNGFVERKEFGYFLRYVVYYNNLWSLFATVDTDSDRRITREEFMAAFDKLPLASGNDAQDVFAEMDTNKGGMILFDELIHYMATTNDDDNKNIISMEYVKLKASEPDKEHATTKTTPSAPEPLALPKAVTQISIPGEEKVMHVFDQLDENASGKLSLAELDKGIVTLFPDWNNKPAIMAAYKAADRSDNGFVERKEFGYFLRYIVYYNNLWSLFDDMDDDSDRRITLDEFTDAADLLALPRDAQAIFREMDTNGGGMILFQEFVDWMATNEPKFESSDKNDIHDVEQQLDALASS